VKHLSENITPQIGFSIISITNAERTKPTKENDFDKKLICQFLNVRNEKLDFLLLYLTIKVYQAA
jgi:hypothetical protein